jgi:hypothetical protein
MMGRREELHKEALVRVYQNNHPLTRRWTNEAGKREERKARLTSIRVIRHGGE